MPVFRQAPRLAVVLAAVAASGATATFSSAAGGAGTQAARGSAGPPLCGKRGVVCRRVSVPLDWSGETHGKVSLQVEVRKATGTARGVMFLMAGGPGQASTRYFDIGDGGYWSLLFPHFTLVTFDPRGTGSSSPLKCHVARVAPGQDASAAVARCAQQLGPARNFFGTRDNVMDIDAIRSALGYPRIGIYGASYGTDLALAYTRAFPARVQRLVLDSVASPLTGLPVLEEILRQLPSILNAYCAHVCDENYGRDVVTLANSIAAKPLRGPVVQPDGARRLVTLTAPEFLLLVIQTDLDPGLAAELPAAVQAAGTGDPAPLLRLADLTDTPLVGRVDPVYAATSCDDGPLPWQSDTPIAQRPALLKATLAGVPKGSLGRLGPWAAEVGNASICLRWPAAPVRAPISSSPYPNVPLLAVSGALDLRSPSVEARGVLAHFPRGRLVRVTNAGHAALATYPSRCLLDAVHSWLNGGSVPNRCGSARLLTPVAPLDRAEAPATTPADVLSIVGKTVHEAEAAWLLLAYEGIRTPIPGVRAGRLAATNRGFALAGYSLADGVDLSGGFVPEFALGNSLVSLHGIVRVKIGAASIGTLALNGDALDGSLEGKTVVDGRVVPAGPAPSVGSTQAWSAWAPPSGSTAQIANAIASHVADEYQLTDGGQKLVAVKASPPVAPRGKKDAVSAIVVRAPSQQTGKLVFHATLGTWTYTLCGDGGNCSIGHGPPTADRGRLVRREALEIALDTFEFLPQVSTIVEYLPPPAPELYPTTLLYVQRSELAKQLAQPLAATLTRASPPLPSDPDTAEAQRIDTLTLPHLFDYAVFDLGDGSAALDLFPAS